MTDNAPERSAFREPTRWRSGDVLEARKLNETVDAVTSLARGIRGPQQMRTTGRQGQVVIRQFKVRSVAGDYIVCEQLEGGYENDGDGSYIWVAKPYLLRRTPFDGSSRDGIEYTYTDDETRTATDVDDHTESQVIVPSYVEGDVIYAASVIAGGTGVYVEINGEESSVVWLDLNLDGRAWAAA